jgi:hypothetical protein
MKNTKFKDYIEKLRKEVISRPPNNEVERGFKMAVMLIHEHYKLEDKINEN